MNEGMNLTNLMLWMRTLTAGAAALTLLIASGPAAGEPEPVDEAAEAPSTSAPSASSSSPTSVPALRQMTNVAVITIEGVINGVTPISVERRIGEALDAGADGLVFEIDSPGGEVGAVLEICSMIKAQQAYTIAWVNDEASSGGAIIGLACDEMVAAPGSSVGNAAQVAVRRSPLGSTLARLPPTERAKLLAPLLAEVVDSARQNGYDEVLVQSMVSLGVETWHVVDQRTARSYFLTRDEYTRLFGEAPSAATPRVPSGVTNRDAAPDLTGLYQDDETGQGAASGAPLGTGDFNPATDLFTPGMVRVVNDSLQTASARPDFAREDPSNYQLVGYATDGQALLTMKEADLRRFGFVDPSVTIATDQDLLRHVGATNIVRLKRSWSESVVSFMLHTHWGMLIRGGLIVGFLLFMFLEMLTPGMGVFGTLAVVSLVGLVVPPMLINAAMWWTLAAILGGIGLILLEVFVFPGFGLPGLAGMGLVLAGLIGSFAGAGELFPGASGGGLGDLTWAVAIVLIALFASGVGVYFASRYTRSLPVLNKLILADGESRAPDAPRGGGMLSAMGPKPAPTPEGAAAVGDVGVVTAPLRPSGSAEFGDRLIDVVSEAGFVEKGARVRVVSSTAYRVGVEPVREADGPGGSV